MKYVRKRAGSLSPSSSDNHATGLPQVTIHSLSNVVSPKPAGGGHYHPSPLLFLAGYATRTERIILGTDIVILPLYHPVRLAEDIAEMDIMSKGRVILGVAIGYRNDEFAAFQVPMEKRGAQFVEMIRLIKRLWCEGEVSYASDRYRLDRFSLEPKPVQPHPPTWIGGWGELAIKRAAQLGDAWLPGPTADLTKLKEAQSRYHAHLAGMGIDLLTRPRPLTRDVIIASPVSSPQRCKAGKAMNMVTDATSPEKYPISAWGIPSVRRCPGVKATSCPKKPFRPARRPGILQFQPSPYQPGVP